MQCPKSDKYSCWAIPPQPFSWTQQSAPRKPFFPWMGFHTYVKQYKHTFGEIRKFLVQQRESTLPILVCAWLAPRNLVLDIHRHGQIGQLQKPSHPSDVLLCKVCHSIRITSICTSASCNISQLCKTKFQIQGMQKKQADQTKS